MSHKILEVGGYPPPRTGWAMRIYYLKKAMDDKGIDCKVLHVGKNRRVPSPHYIGTRNGIDMVLKMIWYALKGYRTHGHINGDSPKGFIITFLALFFITVWPSVTCPSPAIAIFSPFLIPISSNASLSLDIFSRVISVGTSFMETAPEAAEQSSLVRNATFLDLSCIIKLPSAVNNRMFTPR